MRQLEQPSLHCYREQPTDLAGGVERIMSPNSRDSILSPIVAPEIHAELIALKAIVMAVTAVMSQMYERSGHGPAQGWINNIAALCDDGIAKARFEPEGPEAEDIRRAAREQVTQILAGLSGGIADASRSN
jgi:hypothetical protein